MQHNSVRYIVLFAGAVCVLCSFFVSTAAVFLKDRQQANELLDKQEKVLEVSGLLEELVEEGLLEEGKRPSKDQVSKSFDERIVMRLIDLDTDAAAADGVGIDPATYDQLAASKDPRMSAAVPSNFARVRRVPRYAVVYEVFKDAENEELDLRVIPIEGMGLWGTMYGFLALDSDGNTIRGLTFYKTKETPGLGKEVEYSNWQKKWPGRKVFDENWEVAIKVIKGVAGPPSEAPHQVDGLSGATLTSKGVTNLLRFWLGDDGFGPYLAQLRPERSGA